MLVKVPPPVEFRGVPITLKTVIEHLFDNDQVHFGRGAERAGRAKRLLDNLGDPGTEWRLSLTDWAFVYTALVLMQTPLFFNRMEGGRVTESTQIPAHVYHELLESFFNASIE